MNRKQKVRVKIKQMSIYFLESNCFGVNRLFMLFISIETMM